MGNFLFLLVYVAWLVPYLFWQSSCLGRAGHILILLVYMAYVLLLAEVVWVVCYSCLCVCGLLLCHFFMLIICYCVIPWLYSVVV